MLSKQAGLMETVKSSAERFIFAAELLQGLFFKNLESYVCFFSFRMRLGREVQLSFFFF